jgi:hypothetical protein
MVTMKIYDGKKVVIGLVVFVVLMGLPIWYNMGKAAPAPEIKIDTAAIQAMPKKQCILPKEEMRTEHMQLLNDWRNWAVRDGLTVYVAADGKQYNMSLQKECMECHSNKTEFCDRCHTYAGMTSSTPYCWTCHIPPKEKK